MSREEAIDLIIKHSFNRFEGTIKFLMLYDNSLSVSENARRLGYKKANASALVRRYKLDCIKAANGYGGVHYTFKRQRRTK